MGSASEAGDDPLYGGRLSTRVEYATCDEADLASGIRLAWSTRPPSDSTGSAARPASHPHRSCDRHDEAGPRAAREMTGEMNGRVEMRDPSELENVAEGLLQEGTSGPDTAEAGLRPSSTMAYQGRGSSALTVPVEDHRNSSWRGAGTPPRAAVSPGFVSAGDSAPARSTLLRSFRCRCLERLDRDSRAFSRRRKGDLSLVGLRGLRNGYEDLLARNSPERRCVADRQRARFKG